ncbi:hypothetical protein ACFV19_14850 [Streptomyces griseoluteus]|uniref:hypothetical protein n=1 Tax=Streptomyces griseoluteus TaxID=29306 RepID=UPI00368CD54C
MEETRSGACRTAALVLADNVPPIVTRFDGMWTWDSLPEIEGHVRDLRGVNEAERTRRATEKRNQAKAHVPTSARRGPRG